MQFLGLTVTSGVWWLCCFVLLLHATPGSAFWKTLGVQRVWPGTDSTGPPASGVSTRDTTGLVNIAGLDSWANPASWGAGGYARLAIDPKNGGLYSASAGGGVAATGVGVASKPQGKTTVKVGALTRRLSPEGLFDLMQSGGSDEFSQLQRLESVHSLHLRNATVTRMVKIAEITRREVRGTATGAMLTPNNFEILIRSTLGESFVLHNPNRPENRKRKLMETSAADGALHLHPRPESRSKTHARHLAGEYIGFGEMGGDDEESADVEDKDLSGSSDDAWDTPSVFFVLPVVMVVVGLCRGCVFRRAEPASQPDNVDFSDHFHMSFVAEGRGRL